MFLIESIMKVKQDPNSHTFPNQQHLTKLELHSFIVFFVRVSKSVVCTIKFD